MKIKITIKEWIIFIIIGIALTFLPFIFTHKFFVENFSDKGEVGDVIGGVTAPFLSLFGSILVFLALKAQVDANYQIQEQITKQEFEEELRRKIDYFENRIYLITTEINNFTYVYSEYNSFLQLQEKHSFTGVKGIYSLLKKNQETFYGKIKRTPYQLEPNLAELRELLSLFYSTAQSINSELFDKENNKNKDIKNKLQVTLKYYFNAKFRFVFNEMRSFIASADYKKCGPDCQNNHGLPPDLFTLYDQIEKELK